MSGGEADRGHQRWYLEHRIRRDEIRRKTLHIPGQYHQIDMILLQQFQLLPLALRFFSGLHGHIMKRHAMKLRQGTRVFVVAHDRHDFAAQLANSPAMQQIFAADNSPAESQCCAHPCGLL